MVLAVKEEKGRGRENRRDRVGEKCSASHSPLKREILCVRVSHILKAGHTLTYCSTSLFMLLCSSVPDRQLSLPSNVRHTLMLMFIL